MSDEQLRSIVAEAYRVISKVCFCPYCLENRVPQKYTEQVFVLLQTANYG